MNMNIVSKTKPSFFTQNFLNEVFRCAKKEVEYLKNNSTSCNRARLIMSCIKEEKYSFFVLYCIQDLISNYKEEFTAPLYFINKIEIEAVKMKQNPIFSTHYENNFYYLKEIK